MNPPWGNSAITENTFRIVSNMCMYIGKISKGKRYIEVMNPPRGKFRNRRKYIWNCVQYIYIYINVNSTDYLMKTIYGGHESSEGGFRNRRKYI